MRARPAVEGSRWQGLDGDPRADGDYLAALTVLEALATGGHRLTYPGLSYPE